MPAGSHSPLRGGRPGSTGARPRSLRASSRAPRVRAAVPPMPWLYCSRWAIPRSLAIQEAGLDGGTMASGAAESAPSLLDVRAANRRWRDRSTDYACDGDQGQDIRKRLEQHRRIAPRLREAKRQRCRAAEQKRGGECTERPPVAEDDRGQRDEAAARGHALDEGAEVAERQVRAAERGQHARQGD